MGNFISNFISNLTLGLENCLDHSKDQNDTINGEAIWLMTIGVLITIGYQLPGLLVVMYNLARWFIPKVRTMLRRPRPNQPVPPRMTALPSISSLALTDATCVGMLLVGVGVSYTLATCYPQLIMAGAFVTCFGFGLNGMAWVTSNKPQDYLANVPNIVALLFNSLLVWLAVESFSGNREFFKIDKQRWGRVGSPKVILGIAWVYHSAISLLCVGCWMFSNTPATKERRRALRDVLSARLAPDLRAVDHAPRTGDNTATGHHQGFHSSAQRDHVLSVVSDRAADRIVELKGNGPQAAKLEEQLQELTTDPVIRAKYKISAAFGGIVSIVVFALAITNAVDSEGWLRGPDDNLEVKSGFKAAPYINCFEAGLFGLQWLLLVAALIHTSRAYQDHSDASGLNASCTQPHDTPPPMPVLVEDHACVQMTHRADSRGPFKAVATAIAEGEADDIAVGPFTPTSGMLARQRSLSAREEAARRGY